MKKIFISEFIAILIVVMIAIVSVILFQNFIGATISRAQPKIEYLEASTSGIEVLYSGPGLEIEDSDGEKIFTANYIYKVTVILNNAGDQPIVDIEYKTISVDEDISVCKRRYCDIYDPVEFTSKYTELPKVLAPNQATTISFVILSKVNLLELDDSPFIIKIYGKTPSGDTCKVYVNPLG